MSRPLHHVPIVHDALRIYAHPGRKGCEGPILFGVARNPTLQTKIKRGNIFWKQSSSVCDATAEARQHVPRECWMLQSLKFHVDSSNTSSSWFSKIQSPGKTRKHLGNPLAGGSRASISVDPWSDARNGMLLIQTRLWRLTTLGEDEGRPADRTEVEPGLGKISVIQFGGWNLGGWRGA